MHCFKKQNTLQIIYISIQDIMHCFKQNNLQIIYTSIQDMTHSYDIFNLTKFHKTRLFQKKTIVLNKIIYK